MSEYQEKGESQDELDAVPNVDNGEPLVDFLEACPRLVFAPVHPAFDFPRVHLVRKRVAEMLCEAAALLEKENSDYRLQIVEGYRPMSVQRAMNRAMLERFRAENPDWSDEQVQNYTNRFSAPPDAKSPPPHITGGAIDLEIIDERGQSLDFSSPYAPGDYQFAALDAPEISDVAKKNRALLKRVLEPTGLTNYVAEWWHWSYGDAGWALRTGAPHAIYDRIELPANVHWVGDLAKMP
jgi:zinc D-Ala-D-Ala dipeptidase